MSGTIKRVAMTAGCLALLAGCASGTPIAYYLLTPQPADNGTDPAIAPAMPALDVSLPAYADRPQIVFQDPDGTVELEGNDRWAESLDSMLRRVLAQDIAQRQAAMGNQAIHVGIDAFIFGDGFVRLTAHWTVTMKKPPAGTRALFMVPVHRFSADLPVPDKRIDAYVQAMSALVAQLAAAIVP